MLQRPRASTPGGSFIANNDLVMLRLKGSIFVVMLDTGDSALSGASQ
jgi:hypothetical protein